MGDESSNDTSIVAITSDDDFDDKPIKKLFKRLINNDSKQNTILTNNQILDMLKVEFDVNIYRLHNLEIDIYITLLKKYLKDWPLWDEFDRTVNEAKKKNDLPSIEGMLQVKYDHLKSYLQSVIDIASSLAKDAVNKVKSNIKKEKTTKTEVRETLDSVVMELHASRSQLNTLFFRHPSTFSVFNVNDQKTTIVVPGERKIESILNWWDVNIEISRKNGTTSTVLYRREMIHKLKHILVNKIAPHTTEPLALSQELLVKNSKKSKVIEKEALIRYIDDIASASPILNSVNEILKFIKMDLFLMPNSLFTVAHYKRHMNRYAYIRYLYKDIGTVKSEKHDLQLEETISPMFKLFVGDFSPILILEVDSIKVECVSCNVTFSGINLVAELREHFEEHCSETDWTCTRCHITIPMLELASRWWSHRCLLNDDNVK